MAAALCLGAHGVNIGTRFLASMGGDYGTVPRALRSPFVARWLHQHGEAQAEEEALRHAVLDAIDRGTLYDLVPFAGQSVGMIHDAVPAATIVQRIVTEADDALARVSGRLGHAA